MKQIYFALAVVAALTTIGDADAQQHQEFGRGSLYLVPGQPSKSAAASGPDSSIALGATAFT